MPSNSHDIALLNLDTFDSQHRSDSIPKLTEGFTSHVQN